MDMRGYGESDKPHGIGSYSYDKLLKDIKDLIEFLGKLDKSVTIKNYYFLITRLNKKKKLLNSFCI